MSATQHNREEPQTELLSQLYRAFNAREIDLVLASLAPDVDWPNGMEGGRVHGRAAVRQYWLRQWGLINPQVEPRHISTDDAGHTVVDVHQVVRDLSGKILADQMIQHVYTIGDGMVHRMDIRNLAATPGDQLSD